jgi:hypothetical protein
MLLHGGQPEISSPVWAEIAEKFEDKKLLWPDT